MGWLWGSSVQKTWSEVFYLSLYHFWKIWGFFPPFGYWNFYVTPRFWITEIQFAIPLTLWLNTGKIMASITNSALENLYGVQWSSGKLGLALNPGSVEKQLQIRLIKWQDFCREGTVMCLYLWTVYIGEGVKVWITKHKYLPNYRNCYGPIS